MAISAYISVRIRDDFSFIDVFKFFLEKKLLNVVDGKLEYSEFDYSFVKEDISNGFLNIEISLLKERPGAAFFANYKGKKICVINRNDHKGIMLDILRPNFYKDKIVDFSLFLELLSDLNSYFKFDPPSIEYSQF